MNTGTSRTLTDILNDPEIVELRRQVQKAYGEMHEEARNLARERRVDDLRYTAHPDRYPPISGGTEQRERDTVDAQRRWSQLDAQYHNRINGLCKLAGLPPHNYSYRRNPDGSVGERYAPGYDAD